MSRVHRYVGLVSTAAIVACALLVMRSPGPHSGDWSAILWLSLLGAAAQVQGYQLPNGGSGSIAFIPFLACAIVSPNWGAALAIAAANLIAEAFIRRAPLKILFNVAQTLLAMSLGILCYLVLGGVALIGLSNASLLRSGNVIALPFLALVFVFFTTNTFAVSGVIAASTGSRVLQVWKSNSLGTIVYDVFSAPIVFLFALVFVQVGPLAAVGLGALLFGAKQLYKTNRQLQQMNQELLQLMVKAIEARDPYTSGHSRRVQQYSRIIARAIGLNAQQTERVATAALLHDVGKIHEEYAPILQKPGKLTAEEWAIMKTHPIKSAELVATVSQLRPLVPAVRHHHENWDGSGYPDAIRGSQIPLESRIITLADTVDAMTTDRPYRAALGEADVRAELIRCRGKQFDPEICDLLVASPLFGHLFAERESEGRRTPHEHLAPRSGRRLMLLRA
jgi:hypothetical protein